MTGNLEKNYIKKIIFISSAPLSIIVEKKINILKYREFGFNVEFYDLSRINYTKEKIDYYFSGNKKFKYTDIETQLIFCKKTFIERVKYEKKNTIYCFIDFNNFDDYWIRKVFKKYNITYFTGPKVHIVQETKGKKHLEYIQKYKLLMAKITLILKNPSRIMRKLKYILYKYTNYYKKPDFVVTAGMIARHQWLEITQAKSYLDIPSCDILWSNRDSLLDYDYGVFVDDTIYHSPDIGMNPYFKSKKICINHNEYQKNMDRIFDLIENEMNIKIIIAASGKYDYGRNSPYGKRKIIYGKTNELLLHSKIAINHGSNGIYQAYLTSQKILVLDDENIVREKAIGIRQIADILNLEVYNTRDVNIDIIKRKDNKKNYKEIVNKYFLAKDREDDNRMQHEIIVSKIKNLKFKSI